MSASRGAGDRTSGQAQCGACDQCSLRTGCLPRLLGPVALQTFSAMARLKRRVRQGASLFTAGSELTAVYVVRAGTFKTVAVSTEG